jgi:hypothetical protein
LTANHACGRKIILIKNVPKTPEDGLKIRAVAERRWISGRTGATLPACVRASALFPGVSLPRNNYYIMYAVGNKWIHFVKQFPCGIAAAGVI